MTTQPRKASLFESMALGGSSAVFAVNFTHPIETVKTRMQVSGLGINHTVSGLYANEGVAAFWKGILFAYGREISYTSIKLGGECFGDDKRQNRCRCLIGNWKYRCSCPEKLPCASSFLSSFLSLKQIQNTRSVCPSPRLVGRWKWCTFLHEILSGCYYRWCRQFCRKSIRCSEGKVLCWWGLIMDRCFTQAVEEIQNYEKHILTFYISLV